MVKIHQKNKLRRLSLSANFGNSETDSKPVTMFSEAKIEKADQFPKIKVKQYNSSEFTRVTPVV